MPDRLILCYHAVSPTWPADLSVTPDALERQLGELARRGYRSVRFSDAVGDSPTAPVVAITFDDNYRSVLEIAKPLMDRHGFIGTLYVPTHWPDDPRPMRWGGIDVWLDTPHEREMLSLSWQELRDLHAAGWEIGSHTCSHPHLTELDDGALEHELRASKERIEQELDSRCTSLAYPYGDVDRRVADAVRRAGYAAAGTIPRVLRRPESLLWPRTPVFHNDDFDRFKMKISPTLRRLRASAPGTLLDRARVAIADRR